MSRKKKAKTRSRDKGLWIVTAEGTWIEVKKSKVAADKIVPQPAIRYGKPYIEGKPIELVENATFPVYRENIIALIKKKFAALDFTPDKLFPDDPIAETRLSNLVTAIMTLSQEIPLDSYTRAKVDRQLRKTEEWEKYRVVSVNKAGREVLEPFPYLEMTHQLWEKDPNTGAVKVLPRIYYDMWLTETLYELPSQNDAGRFELWRLAQKLNNYPFPVPNKEGTPKLKDGEPVVEYEEGMLYYEGYVAQTGSSQQYHAFVIPKRITTEDSTDEFILEMKLSKTLKKYQKTQLVPAEGEVPMVVTTKQKPLVMQGVAEMLRKVAAV